MDYEKAYKSLIEELRQARNDERKGYTFCSVIDGIVPELNESEDERIRKNILALVKKHAVNHERCQMEDYLEKQKEKPICLSAEGRKRLVETIYSDIEEVVKGAEKRLSYFPFLKSQKEQKPADDKAFEEWIDDWWKYNKVNNPDSYENGDEIQFDERDFKNFCRGIRNMYQQKPAEWSEEDGKMLDRLKEILNIADAELCKKLNGEAILIGEAEYTYLKFGIAHCLSWLELRFKSLRPQPHWKPSEQEKGALRTAISIFTDERNFPKAAAQLQNILDAFEGEEPRKDWKPSKEQMEWIECAMIHSREMPRIHPIIVSLYEQLKKL